jgi:hypothetical protein
MSAPASTPQVPQQQPRPGDLILQIGSGYIASMALHAVIELGIADHLAREPRAVADLAREVHANEDALYRTLRLLASLGIFTESAPRVFAHTPASETLRTGVPGSMRDLVRWWADPFHFRVYAEFMHSLRTGQTCVEKITGGLPIFDYFPTDPQESEVFNNAMTSFSSVEVPAALAAYDFSGIGVLVDIAGGHGQMICAILEKYPQMRGILTDLDHVLAGAAQAVRRAGMENRCALQTCDFFHSAPAGGDAYILKHIIHDWDDFKALAILRNIHTAMGEKKGKVILLEMVLTPGNDPHPGKFLDMEMLAIASGRERTEAEFAELFQRAGFRLTRILPTESPVCVVEAVKV